MYKILKIVAAALGLIGIIFLVRIISIGDTVIKAGDNGSVDPMVYIGYIILGLTVVFVLFFVLKNLLTHTSSLKSTLMGLGSFSVVALICYFVLANGVETPLRDGEVLSASGSRLVGAGLYMFYALAVIACGTMLLFGLKKMIK
jgi:hypothetical protein